MLYNCADDSAITATCHHLANLLNRLETDSDLIVNWFRQTKLILNLDKFQDIVINKQGNKELLKLRIDGKDITATNCKTYLV